MELRTRDLAVTLRNTPNIKIVKIKQYYRIDASPHRAPYSLSSFKAFYLKHGFRRAVICPVSSVDVSGHLSQFVAPRRSLSLSSAALILRREMHAGLQLHLRLVGYLHKEK